MVLQDMRHCSKHCMEDLSPDSWTCGYIRWWRWHTRKCYAGCYFGNVFQHEILVEEFEKLKD